MNPAGGQPAASLGELRPGLMRVRPFRPAPRRRSPWPARIAAILLVTVMVLPSLLILPLRWVDPPGSSYMLQSPTKPVRHDWVEGGELGLQLPLAVVASEDQKFARHHGFDFDAIADALAETHRRRGASTISQQTVKNLFLWPGGYIRKAIEAWFTVWLELWLPKARILEIYLNIAEFGPGIYGAGAASRAHFGVEPAALSARQAAHLAALLPAPRRWDTTTPYVQERAQWIERHMHKLGESPLGRPR